MTDDVIAVQPSSPRASYRTTRRANTETSDRSMEEECEHGPTCQFLQDPHATLWHMRRTIATVGKTTWTGSRCWRLRTSESDWHALCSPLGRSDESPVVLAAIRIEVKYENGNWSRRGGDRVRWTSMGAKNEREYACCDERRTHSRAWAVACTRRTWGGGRARTEPSALRRWSGQVDRTRVGSSRSALSPGSSVGARPLRWGF